MVYCPLPWKSLYINNDGAQKICCRSSINIHHSLDFNHDEIKKVRLQMLKDEIPHSCEYCEKAEKNGGLSLRQDSWAENSITDFSTHEDGGIDLPPAKIDIILGNKCNLKCMMCMPWCSSQWGSDWNEITSGYQIDVPSNAKDQTGLFRIYEQDCFDNQKIIDLIKSSAAYYDKVPIWLSGGEVMLTPMFKEILQELYDFKDKLAIDVLSNGTSLSPSLETLMRQFPHLRIHYSIDGIGTKNDYIRFPSKFSVIEKNIKKMLDKAGKIYITVSAMNVFDISDIVIWAEALGLETHFEVVYGHLIRLSPMSLPRRIRKEAAHRILNLVNYPLRYTHKKDLIALAESIQTTQRWEPNMTEFWNLIKKFDHIRNTDFLGTFEKWQRFV